jgi:hypothetical protein
MALFLDPVVAANLIFDLAILCLGVILYKRRESSLALWVGIGFAFFAVSYILTILGFGADQPILVPLRIIGYLSVIFGLLMPFWKR